jgi:D-3-phosphoglycerate dehydrogenase
VLNVEPCTGIFLTVTQKFDNLNINFTRRKLLIKVLLADRFSQKAVELLKEIPEFEIIDNPGRSLDQLKEEPGVCEALVVSGASDVKLTGALLSRATNLKIIIKTGMEIDNIDLDYARSRNIEVRNTPFATSVSVAEYTLAQMLGICRYIGPAYSSMKTHKWENRSFAHGKELHGKTAGIIGMGRIGKEVARRQLVLGMKVVFYDIEDVETELDARQAPLEELLKVSDFISIHVPLSDSTRNLLSAAEFEKMKAGVVLVNVSQGGVVDEASLMKALDGDKIRAVALDVHEEEPPRNFELIDHVKVYPAPHLGGATVEAYERADLDAIAILKEFFNV